MCAICSMGVPVCSLAGGCGVEVLDYIKIAGMTGSAGLGVALTTLRANAKNRNKKKTQDKNG